MHTYFVKSPRAAEKHRFSTVLNCKPCENLHSFTTCISRIVTVLKNFSLLEVREVLSSI